MPPWYAVVVFGIVGVAVVLSLTGCGSSSSVSTNTEGTARFTIVWPERTSRLIPEGANSIKLDLVGASHVTRVVPRPPAGTNTTTVTLSDITVGDYTVTATAHPDTSGFATAQASGSLPLTVRKGETVDASLTMDSTITSVDIRSNGVTIASGLYALRFGTSVNLDATAYDSTGAVVLVAPGQWVWGNDNTTNFTVTPSGATANVLAHNTYASITISLRESESGKTAAVTLNARPELLFDGLGHLPANTSTGNGAAGISDDASTIVGFNLPSGNLEGFYWKKATGLVTYGISVARPAGLANGISGDGATIVGESRTSGEIQAYRGTISSGIQLLGDLPGGNVTSTAKATSLNGSVIVGWGTGALNQQAFRWTAATGMQGIGFLMDPLMGSFVRSQALGVSRDGTTIVGSSTSTASLTESTSSMEAFRWTAASGMVGLGALPGGPFNSKANGVSADGTVVVGESDSANGHEAFLWTATGGMIALGDLPGGTVSSRAFAVSADGRIALGFGRSDQGTEAFIWTAALGMRNLNSVLKDHGISLTGWLLSDCTAITPDNKTIVGTGLHNGVQEGFRLYKADGFDKP
jgi:probable HAF family extracellular repeat protein